MFSDKLPAVVYMALCAFCLVPVIAADDFQADESSLLGIVPSSDIIIPDEGSNEQDEPLDAEKRAMPGVMRFGKRGDMPGVLRFGKRAMPGVMRFGKKAMPGVMRFGKKSMPGVMRFGKRMMKDEEDMEKRRAGPAPIRFG